MAPTHPYQQRYMCPECHTTKMLPEHPTNGPRNIRMGCPTCRSMRRFKRDIYKRDDGEDDE